MSGVTILMYSHPISARLRYSLAFGGKCAFIVAPPLLVFMFVTILMVGGDGKAPGVAHLSAALIQLPVKLLGLPFAGAIVPAVLFWWLVVFGGAFLYAFISSARAPSTDLGKSPYWPIVAVPFAIGAVVVLVHSHRSETASVNEEALALEFVRTHPEILDAVDFVVAVSPVMIMGRQGRSALYEIHVEGTRTLYAVVETSNATRVPTFTLLCIVPPDKRQRDSFKHPCEQ